MPTPTTETIAPPTSRPPVVITGAPAAGKAVLARNLSSLRRGARWPQLLVVEAAGSGR
jgi:predicted ATPase